MFEERNTEDIILQRMLNKIPEELDKRESSFIYNSLAPIALELAMAYSNLDRYLEYTFVNENTPDEYLEKRVSEVGINRKQPTRTIKKAAFYSDENSLMDVPINSRFYIEGLIFKAIEKINTGIYKMECEKVGTISNNITGNLIPIDYISNLGIAKLLETLEEGKDIEKKEDLYMRFSNKNKNPTTSGNANHYKQWALEVDGVGKAKVFPLWDGNGTIKLVIVDSNKKTPSKELIKKVINHIEEVRPIGVKVTINGAIEKRISISAKIMIANGFNISEVQKEFTKGLDNYLKDMAFQASYISIAKIGNLLLNTPGVLDYTDLRLNSGIANIGLEDEEIPILGNIELGV